MVVQFYRVDDRKATIKARVFKRATKIDRNPTVTLKHETTEVIAAARKLKKPFHCCQYQNLISNYINDDLWGDRHGTSPRNFKAFIASIAAWSMMVDWFH